MRDDSSNWNPLQTLDADIQTDGVAVSKSYLRPQTIVSGPRVLLEFEFALSWPEIAKGDTYHLSLRRDRILAVEDEDLGPDGWDTKTNQAVSDASGAFEVFEARARALLDRGGELQEPSKSVSRLLFGFSVFLYRYKRPDCYRLHVERAHGQALFQSLAAASKAIL